MRQLFVLRHAKAVLAEPGMEDFDRPLAERGQKAAALMGRYLAQHALVPDLVLCSSARRTRETWEIAARELPETTARFLDALYDFGDGPALVKVLRAEGGEAKRLLLVVHNPAAQALALDLAGSGDKVLRRQMMERYPTAALAVLSFGNGRWADTAEGSGRLDAFIRPRELPVA